MWDILLGIGVVKLLVILYQILFGNRPSGPLGGIF